MVSQLIVDYAAREWVLHIEMATGVRMDIVKESAVPERFSHRIYLGSTRAASEIGIDVTTLPSEAFALRTAKGHLFIAAQDGPGDPLDMSNKGLTHAKICVETAELMNSPHADAAARSAAIEKLIAYRRGVASSGIANLDRLSVIELESWKDTPGFASP